jgi:hypothetical protein
MENSRRNFLKKVAYKAPVVIGLGMMLPTVSDADTFIATSGLNKGQLKQEIKEAFKSDYTNAQWKNGGKQEWKDWKADSFNAEWRDYKNTGDTTINF